MAIFADKYEVRMELQTRQNVLKTILKEAGFFANLIRNKIKERKTGKQDPDYEPNIKFSGPITTAVPGASVRIPNNPFDSTGGFKIMFIFRYHSKTPINQGINAVLVMADVGKQYDGPFITNAIQRVTASLKRVNPQAHLKTWGVSVHSGGYTVSGRVLSQLDSIEKQVGVPMSALVMADAGHVNPKRKAGMDPYYKYAKQAAQNPGQRRFVSMYTNIDPYSKKYGKYTSTREFTGAISDHVGADKNQLPANTLGWQSISSKGGYMAIHTAGEKSSLNEYKADHTKTSLLLPKIWREGLPPVWYN